MTIVIEPESRLLHGPLLREAGRPLPLTLNVRWCDLRPRLIDKGRAGRGYRAIARNGRVLLASNVPLAELPGKFTRLRIQTWHKAILSGEQPAPYGVLLCVHAEDIAGDHPAYVACLERTDGENFDFALDVGGGQVVVFRVHQASS